MQHPQSLLVRKALFQVHLWTGIGLGLYILLISVSGSVLIYQRELLRAFSPKPLIVAGSGDRMTLEELRQAAQRAYPEYRVTQVLQRSNPDQAVEIGLERGGQRRQRLFNPYTGADLGNPLGTGFRLIEWLLDLHDNLLYGDIGRLVNGVGGLFLTMLCLTGAVIWWPGVKNWRRSLTIGWKANWKRFTWDLHNLLGFWLIAFIFMWGISGIYLCFPWPFHAAADLLDPVEESSRVPRLSDTVLLWLTRLHFGSFASWPAKVLWTVLGLVPAVLFVSGALMWWNRVIRNGARQPEERASAASFGRNDSN